MNRPFTVTGSVGSYNTRYYIQNHRGDNLTKKRTIVPDFFQKLLSHPITAFAYRIVDCGIDINPKFDRADVIKAIDFCIQYFVYQNKCDYIMEGTVNKDFEVTVRELVETREAVFKEKADTKFVRKAFGRRDGSSFEYISGPWYYILRNNKVDTNMPKSMVDEQRAITGLKFPKAKRLFKPTGRDVEYTQDMCNFSTQISYGSDQFCYKVMTKTVPNRKPLKNNYEEKAGHFRVPVSEVAGHNTTHMNSTVYENIALTNMNNAAGDLQVTLHTENTMFDMTIPEPSMGSFVDHVSRLPRHIIRIERRANQALERVEVDHRTFPVRSLRIRQGHRDPLSDPSQNFLGRERALQVFLHPRDRLENRFVRMSVTETSITLGQHIWQELTFYDGARTYVKMTIQDPAAMIDINNNGFNDITFPGGGMVSINGVNYAVADDRVEVVTR